MIAGCRERNGDGWEAIGGAGESRRCPSGGGGLGQRCQASLDAAGDSDGAPVAAAGATLRISSAVPRPRGRGVGFSRALGSGLCLAVLASQAGCASHIIRSAEFEPVGIAGQPFRHDSVSVGGRQGVTTEGTGYVTREECQTGDLAEVEVRRSLGQTAITVLTLGIVSPVTLYFHCEKPEVPPPCDCDEGGGEGRD